MYPRVVIDIEKLIDNCRVMCSYCREFNVDITGVVKAVDGDIECAKAMYESGCKEIASSRIRHLRDLRLNGFDAPLMLIRIPMISEARDVVAYSDISMNSDIDVIKSLNDEAIRQGKIHKVVLMVEMGDLREGVWDDNILKKIVTTVEQDMRNVELIGVGTNFGCYGSILPTKEKLEEFTERVAFIEEIIGRKLEMTSVGGSACALRVLDRTLPPGINNIRMGDALIVGKDFLDLYGFDVPSTHRDVVTLEAEVIEVYDKPSHPMGEIAYDGFSKKKRVYEDKGIRKRALLGVGRVDYGTWEGLTPRMKGVEVLGSSSDHTVLDIEDTKEKISTGDILILDLHYLETVLSCCADDVGKVYIRGKT